MANLAYIVLKICLLSWGPLSEINGWKHKNHKCFTS